MRHRGRSFLPRMKTWIQEDDTLDETYQNVMNLRYEYAVRIDQLLKEATRRGAGSEDFDETRLSKTIQEDNKMMILQLKQDENGTVWKQTNQIQTL